MDLVPFGKPIYEHFGPTPKFYKIFISVSVFAFIVSICCYYLTIGLVIIFEGVPLDLIFDINLLIVFIMAYIIAIIVYYLITIHFKKLERSYVKIYENGIEINKFHQGNSSIAPKTYEDLNGFNKNSEYRDFSSFIPLQRIKEIYPIYSTNKKKVWIIIRSYYWYAYPKHGFDQDEKQIVNEIMDKIQIIP